MKSMRPPGEAQADRSQADRAVDAACVVVPQQVVPQLAVPASVGHVAMDREVMRLSQLADLGEELGAYGVGGVGPIGSVDATVGP